MDMDMDSNLIMDIQTKPTQPSTIVLWWCSGLTVNCPYDAMIVCDGRVPGTVLYELVEGVKNDLQHTRQNHDIAAAEVVPCTVDFLFLAVVLVTASLNSVD